MPGCSVCFCERQAGVVTYKNEGSRCKGDEILGLAQVIHIFPSSIKGDATGNPMFFVFSHFPLESWALLESDLNSRFCLIYIHTAKAGGLTQGYHSRFSTVTAGSSHSAQGTSCAVFSAVTYLHCRRYGLQSLFLLFKSSVSCDMVPYS